MRLLTAARPVESVSRAAVGQWYDCSFPSCSRGFDSRQPVHPRQSIAYLEPGYMAAASASISAASARKRNPDLIVDSRDSSNFFRYSARPAR